MASIRDSSTFFNKGNSKQFDYVLNLYPTVLKMRAEKRNKKPDELIRLDDWYQNELPKLIKERGKDAHMIHEELVQTMKWKQSRGKYYPQLSYLVKVNTPRAVMQETKKAFRKLPNLEQAITALSNLKGVGTTMASALLAAAAPESAPFMADECLMAIPEIEGIDYTTKEYLNFVSHIQSTVTRLNSEQAAVAAAAAATAAAVAQANGANADTAINGDTETNSQKIDANTDAKTASQPLLSNSTATKVWSAHRVELALWTHYIASEMQPELLDGMPGAGGSATDSNNDTLGDDEDDGIDSENGGDGGGGQTGGGGDGNKAIITGTLDDNPVGTSSTVATNQQIIVIPTLTGVSKTSKDERTHDKLQQSDDNMSDDEPSIVTTTVADVHVSALAEPLINGDLGSSIVATHNDITSTTDLGERRNVSGASAETTTSPSTTSKLSQTVVPGVQHLLTSSKTNASPNCKKAKTTDTDNESTRTETKTAVSNRIDVKIEGSLAETAVDSAVKPGDNTEQDTDMQQNIKKRALESDSVESIELVKKKRRSIEVSVSAPSLPTNHRAGPISKTVDSGRTNATTSTARPYLSLPREATASLTTDDEDDNDNDIDEDEEDEDEDDEDDEEGDDDDDEEEEEEEDEDDDEEDDDEDDNEEENGSSVL